MCCPKCGFHSFDYLDACKKCNEDLRPYKAKKGAAATIAPTAFPPVSSATPPAPGFESPPSPAAPALFSVPQGLNLEEFSLDTPAASVPAPPVPMPPPLATAPAPTAAPSPPPLSLDLDLGSLDDTKVEPLPAPPLPTPTAPKVPEFTLDFGPPKAESSPRFEPSPAAAPPLELVMPSPSPKPLPLVSPPIPMAPPAEPLAWETPAPATDILSRPRGGFWIRFTAQIVDGVILNFIITLIFIILFFALGMEQLVPKLGQSPQQMMDTMGSFFTIILLLNAVSIAIYAAYFIYFHGAKGQTPGKMLFKLKVIQTNGQDMTYGKSLIRFLGYIVNQFTLLIGFIWAAFDKEKQGLHDKIAGTYVVKIG